MGTLRNIGLWEIFPGGSRSLVSDELLQEDGGASVDQAVSQRLGPTLAGGGGAGGGGGRPSKREKERARGMFPVQTGSLMLSLVRTGPVHTEQKPGYSRLNPAFAAKKLNGPETSLGRSSGAPLWLDYFGKHRNSAAALSITNATSNNVAPSITCQSKGVYYFPLWFFAQGSTRCRNDRCTLLASRGTRAAGIQV